MERSWFDVKFFADIDEHPPSFLAYVHHIISIKFNLENGFDFSVHGHADLAAVVKASNYFQGLLPLQVECWDIDGDHTTLPIIFEDIYCEPSVGKQCKFYR